MTKTISIWLLYTLLLCLGAGVQAAEDKPPQGIQNPNPGAELWNEVRQRDGASNTVTQARGVDAHILINETGETWRLFRMDYLIPYSGYLMGGMLALVVLLSIRGPMRVEGGMSGKTIRRFSVNERMTHWFMVILFMLLAFSGLVLLFGRTLLIPLMGHEAFGILASACKEIHNLIGPMFIFGILAMFIVYVRRNIPAKCDIKWLLKLGGVFGHAKAGFFNAGEKILFWSTMGLSTLIIISGLVLDFSVFGQGRQIMEAAHLVHAIAAVLMMTMVMGHMWMGSPRGTEGTLSSMTTGDVDENWAKHHHGYWYEEVKAKSAAAEDK